VSDGEPASPAQNPGLQRIRLSSVVAKRALGILLLASSNVHAAAETPVEPKPAPFAIPVPGMAPATDPVTRASENPKPDRSAEIEANKSHLIPALEIVGFDALLNRFNSRSSTDYDVTLRSVRRNLRGPWVTDNDPFKVNQLGHPYQGSMYHGFARSAGLSYWESLAYTFAGSAAWEIAGENTRPSRNDQIATGIGGTFLGEALFRMSNLVLEQWDGVGHNWREVAAAAISPSTAFNRYAFGNRFGAVFASRNPAYYSRLQLGFSGTAVNNQGTSTTHLRRNEALADFSLDYGMPGKPGYEYDRPFDYFNFQGTISSANGFENVMTRGLLIGRSYSAGANHRGVWGLYGNYDYIAPQTFRISTTGLSLGTNGQVWLSKSLALQGTALAGVGYAAVGTIRGNEDELDYHYGFAPQVLLSSRLILDDTAAFDITAREYYVTHKGGTNNGRDNIARIDASLTLRVYHQHAIGLKYLYSRRDATFPDLGSRSQARGTVGIFYTLLGKDRFAAVDWR
jgi:hypothetical protein